MRVMRADLRCRAQWLIVLLFTVVACSWPEVSRAQPPDRPVPNYDGRPEPPPSTEEILAWIPRVLFFPVYLVTEFAIRRPLGWLITEAERARLPHTLIELLTFGPEGQGLIVPTFFFDFGFRPSIGLLVTYDGLLAPSNSVRFHFGTWGPRWLSITALDRLEPPGAPWQAQLRAEFTRRPDQLFWGIGPRSKRPLESRYHVRRYDVRLEFATKAQRKGTLSSWAGIRSASFSNDACCDDVTIADRVAAGQFEDFPPAFLDGYVIYRQGADASFDTRHPRPAPGSGIRVGGQVHHAFDLQEPLKRQWIGYGGHLGAYWDFTGRNTVVSLTATARLVEPIYGTIPFTELPSLAGNGPMRGFRPGHLVGESVTAFALEYRWPVWVFLDGSLHLAAGNAFRGRFDDFSFEKFRLSFGSGLRSSVARDQSVDILIAFGTRPFDEGAGFDSVRFVVGGTRAF